MKLKELMNPNVVTISADDMISKALSKMRQGKFHQLPVLNGKRLEGVLLLKKIVTKNIEPSTTAVGTLTVPAPTLTQDMDTKEAAEKLLLSGLRALPVMDGDNVAGIFGETDLMRVIDNFGLKNDLEDVMYECDTVSIDDDVGKAKKLMVYNNISRVPVTDKGRIVGTVTTLSLIDLILSKEPMEGYGLLKQRGAKEKISIDKTPVKSVMKEAVVINKNSSMQKVAELLSVGEEIFVQDADKFYIVTPKDVVELMAKPEKKGVYVQISNLGEVDAFTNAKIEKKVTEFVQKMGRMMDNLQSFVIHVEHHDKQGKKTKYSVRTRFLTPLGLFVSKSWGWELASVFQEAVDKLEREIMKKHDKISHHERGKRSKELSRR